MRKVFNLFHLSFFPFEKHFVKKAPMNHIADAVLPEIHCFSVYSFSPTILAPFQSGLKDAETENILKRNKHLYSK